MMLTVHPNGSNSAGGCSDRRPPPPTIVPTLTITTATTIMAALVGEPGRNSAHVCCFVPISTRRSTAAYNRSHATAIFWLQHGATISIATTPSLLSYIHPWNIVMGVSIRWLHLASGTGTFSVVGVCRMRWIVLGRNIALNEVSQTAIQMLLLSLLLLSLFYSSGFYGGDDDDGDYGHSDRADSGWWQTDLLLWTLVVCFTPLSRFVAVTDSDVCVRI